MFSTELHQQLRAAKTDLEMAYVELVAVARLIGVSPAPGCMEMAYIDPGVAAETILPRLAFLDNKLEIFRAAYRTYAPIQAEYRQSATKAGFIRPVQCERDDAAVDH